MFHTNGRPRACAASRRCGKMKPPPDATELLESDRRTASLKRKCCNETLGRTCYRTAYTAGRDRWCTLLLPTHHPGCGGHGGGLANKPLPSELEAESFQTRQPPKRKGRKGCAAHPPPPPSRPPLPPAPSGIAWKRLKSSELRSKNVKPLLLWLFSG